MREPNLKPAKKAPGIDAESGPTALRSAV
jgi:hypothetical protein